MDTLLEQASPLPWHTRGKREVESAGGTVVVCGNYNEYGCSPGIDAQLIVRAVNAYEPLVKALEAALNLTARHMLSHPYDATELAVAIDLMKAARDEPDRVEKLIADWSQDFRDAGKEPFVTVESSPEREGGE